jgi:hypothetical protein
MKVLFGIISLISLAFYLNAQSPELIVKWEGKAELKVPESVLFSPENNILFISNIDGNSTDKDGKGFISKMSLTGEIMALRWVDGLDAPKGMGISGNLLYVSNINELVEINITTGKITNRYSAPKSQFLNDIAICESGAVFVSDMRGNAIYKLENGTFELWRQGIYLEGVNGLFCEGTSLYAGAAGNIYKLNVVTGDYTILARNLGVIDGLEMAGNGEFIFSDWAGKISYLDKNGKVTTLIDNTANKVNAADIGFDAKNKIVYSPTFFDNRVIAYQLKR